MNNTVAGQARSTFKQQFADYKKLVDEEIAAYSRQSVQGIGQNYGEQSEIVAQAFSEILARGGKRVRGILTLIGYEMCGGTDQKMILQAARVIEMMHAYMLIIDDIQDQSVLRRNGPSTHKYLENIATERKWQGDPAHTGISLALNAALLGSHGAQLTLSLLDVPAELRSKALAIMSNTMLVTAHGQTHDVINEIAGDISLQEIENVLQWKTAHYTILNPLHMGMVLAGAGCEDTNAITDYALATGKAFQLTDDLLIVSEVNGTGKDLIDDIREGKQTMLTVYAAQHAVADDRKFLASCLGNMDITVEDFSRCQRIFLESGAADYARSQAEKYVADAKSSLNQYSHRWSADSVRFLNDLTDYILNRST